MDEHLTQPDSPSFSPDGKYLYYHVSYSIAEGLGMLTAGHRILRREAATGRFKHVRLSGPAEPTPAFRATLKLGGYATSVGEEPGATITRSVRSMTPGPRSTSGPSGVRSPSRTTASRGAGNISFW